MPLVIQIESPTADISLSGCTSIAVWDLQESECNEAVVELTAFGVGKILFDKFNNTNRLAERCGFHADDFTFLPISGDVSSEESVKGAFATIIEKYGKLDVVVASAGIVENFSALE